MKAQGRLGRVGLGWGWVGNAYEVESHQPQGFWAVRSGFSRFPESRCAHSHQASFRADLRSRNPTRIISLFGASRELGIEVLGTRGLRRSWALVGREMVLMAPETGFRGSYE